MSSIESIELIGLAISVIIIGGFILFLVRIFLARKKRQRTINLKPYNALDDMQDAAKQFAKETKKNKNVNLKDILLKRRKKHEQKIKDKIQEVTDEVESLKKLIANAKKQLDEGVISKEEYFKIVRENTPNLDTSDFELTISKLDFSDKEKKEMKEKFDRIKKSKNYDSIEVARKDFSQGLIDKEEYLRIMRDNN